MSAFVRLSVWDDLECNGGEPLAIVPDRFIVRDEDTEAVDEPDTGILEVANEWPHLSYLTVGAVLRREFTDSADTKERRIADIEDGSGPEGPTTIVTLNPLRAELNRAEFTRVDSEGVPYHDYSAEQITPEDFVDDVLLPALDDAGVNISKGTITPSTPVDLTFEDANGSAMIQALVEKIIAPGIDTAEVDVRRNGGTDLKLDIVSAVASSAPVVDIRTKRNLLRSRRRRLGSQTVTQTRPKGKADGTHSGIGYAFWEITDRNTTDDWIEVADLRGGSYPGPIRFNDQYNGLYVAQLGVSFFSAAVVDSVAATQRIYVADASLFTVGKFVEFRTASGATAERISRLDNPAAQATYKGIYFQVFPVEQISGAINWATNPIFATWTTPSSPPDGSTKYTTLNTVTGAQDSTNTKDFGGTGYKLTTSAVGNHAGGWRSPEVQVYDDSPFAYRIWVWLYVTTQPVAGAVTIRPIFAVDNSDASGGNSIQFPGVPGQEATNGAYYLAEFEITTTSKTSQGLKMEVGIQSTGNATDITVVAWGIQPLAWERSDTYSPSACDLVHAGNDYLELNELPIAYDFEVADLEAMQVDSFAINYDKLVKGGTLRVYDQDLAVTTSQRLMAVTRDYKNPGRTRIRTGTREKTMADLLRARSSRPSAIVGQIVRAITTGIAASVAEGIVGGNQEGFIDVPVYDAPGGANIGVVTIDGVDVVDRITKTLLKSFRKVA